MDAKRLSLPVFTARWCLLHAVSYCGICGADSLAAWQVIYGSREPPVYSHYLIDLDNLSGQIIEVDNYRVNILAVPGFRMILERVFHCQHERQMMASLVSCKLHQMTPMIISCRTPLIVTRQLHAI